MKFMPVLFRFLALLMVIGPILFIGAYQWHMWDSTGLREHIRIEKCKNSGGRWSVKKKTCQQPEKKNQEDAPQP